MFGDIGCNHNWSDNGGATMFLAYPVNAHDRYM